MNEKEIKIGVNYQISDEILNGVHVVAAEEYLLSGDIPSKALARLNWTAKNNGSELKNADESCEIRNLCIQLKSGDLKTFVLTIERP